jgi:cell division protein FtsZ
MGDEVRVTVIAAGFDRWDSAKGGRPATVDTGSVFGDDDDGDVELDLEGDDDFDVPSFLK